MYRLFWASDTGALAPQILLEETGADYEIVEIKRHSDGFSDSEFLKLNPLGKLPALQLADGTVMTESAAIALQICDEHPAAGLLPAPGSVPRALAYQCILFCAAEIYPADLRYFYAQRFGGEEARAAVKAQGLKDMEHLFAHAGTQLVEGPFVLGESFSAADAYLFMLLNWHPDSAAFLARHNTLAELWERVRQRPAVDRIWKMNFPD
ncbi:MAG: glutathione S-transferase family protein [Rhodovibrionaceae bacterium]